MLLLCPIDLILRWCLRAGQELPGGPDELHYEISMKEDKILYQEFVWRINFNKKMVTWPFSTSQDAKHNVQFNKKKFVPSSWL